MASINQDSVPFSRLAFRDLPSPSSWNHDLPWLDGTGRPLVLILYWPLAPYQPPPHSLPRGLWTVGFPQAGGAGPASPAAAPTAPRWSHFTTQRRPRSLPGPPQGPRRARVPSAVTGPTLPPVVRAGSRRVNPEPFLRLVAFCRQVLFYPLNAPRMPARNLSLSSPAPSWSEHPSSLLWIPATSPRLVPLHGRGLLKAIFLEEPGGSFYNANPIASFFASNPSF